MWSTSSWIEWWARLGLRRASRAVTPRTAPRTVGPCQPFFSKAPRNADSTSETRARDIGR